MRLHTNHGIGSESANAIITHTQLVRATNDQQILFSHHLTVRCGCLIISSFSLFAAVNERLMLRSAHNRNF